jgi:hypothetical protein
MITDAIKTKFGVELDRHNVIMDPIRTLGDHKVVVRLTVDLNPEIKVTVYREGEAAPAGTEPEAAPKKSEAEAEAPVEPEAEAAA